MCGGCSKCCIGTAEIPPGIKKERQVKVAATEGEEKRGNRMWKGRRRRRKRERSRSKHAIAAVG